MIYSITDKNILKIEDEESKRIYYGSNQEWYKKRWQRMSGCCPSAATNIIYYLKNSRNKSANVSSLTKKECLNLMNEIWNYVTPGLGGVHSTGMMCSGVQKYINYKNMSIKLDFLDIPNKTVQRPSLLQVTDFIKKALEQDSPVAFLNLEHGSILELESWHWVTIISLEYEIDSDISYVTILDGGIEKRICLSDWLHTTKRGGGFVSFDYVESKDI